MVELFQPAQGCPGVDVSSPTCLRARRSGGIPCYDADQASHYGARRLSPGRRPRKRSRGFRLVGVTIHMAILRRLLWLPRLAVALGTHCRSTPRCNHSFSARAGTMAVGWNAYWIVLLRDGGARTAGTGRKWSAKQRQMESRWMWASIQHLWKYVSGAAKELARVLSL